MPDIFGSLDLDKMEMLVGSELEKSITNLITDMEAVIGQLQLQGVTEAEIKNILFNDLANGGRLFGSLKNGMKYSVATAIGQASNEASRQVFEKAGIKKFKWVAVSIKIGKEPCPDCKPRHGRIETMEVWRNIGMPKSGFSVCQRNCKCRVVPESYNGENLVEPLTRKGLKKKFIPIDEIQASTMAENRVSSAVSNEPLITTLLNNVTKLTGGNLRGLEFKMKELSSLKRKIIKQSRERLWTINEMIKKNITDIIRYTITYDPDNYSQSLKKAIESLKAEGFEILRIKNYWANKTYRGINTVMIKDGQKFELQFHTDKSYVLKNGDSHLLYDVLRKLPLSNIEERNKLLRELEELWDDIDIPSDVFSIGVLLN